MSLLLGLVISTIGTDLQSGSPRFTLGQPELLDGVNILVVVIGLFALGEAFSGIERLGSGAWRPIAHVGRLWLTKAEWLRARWAILRGTVVGFLVGVLPGAGGTVATALAYSLERRWSKYPNEFGKGAIEGVAAPEAANNASVGGALIPMFTLGIPGSSSTAILLSALMMYGIQPGPMLLQNEPELVWGTIASLYVANVILLLLNVPLIGLFVKLLALPPNIINASIAILAVTGAYSVNNSMLDVWLAVMFGVLGVVMTKVGLPKAPLVLGSVLGGTLEQSLRQSLSLSGGNLSIFLVRPGALGLLVAATLVAVGPRLPAALRQVGLLLGRAGNGNERMRA